MKRYLSLFLILILAGLTVLPGCSVRQTETLQFPTAVPAETPAAVETPQPDPTPEAAPPAAVDEDVRIPFTQYGKWGLVTLSGRTVIPFEYMGVEAMDTPGLFLVSKMELVRDGSRYYHAIANREGEFVTDWSSYYPSVGTEALLFWSRDGEGSLLAPETGETFYRVPLNYDDYENTPRACGSLFMLPDPSGSDVEIYEASALKSGPAEPVQRFSLASPDMEEVHGSVIVRDYGSYDDGLPSQAWLLDRDGRIVGGRHSEILAVSSFSTSWTVSDQWLRYSDDGGRTYGLMSLSDGTPVPDLNFGNIESVNGDLMTVTDENMRKVYSLSEKRFLTPEDKKWRTLCLSKDGRAYGCLDSGDWYEIAPSGLRFIANMPDSWEIYSLGGVLYLGMYTEDGPVLLSFDSESLQPVQTGTDYRYVNTWSWGSRGLYYWAGKRDWSIFDLLDSEGRVVLGNCREILSFSAPYAAVVKGFSAGIVDLTTGRWYYKTSRFSSLED